MQLVQDTWYIIIHKDIGLFWKNILKVICIPFPFSYKYIYFLNELFRASIFVWIDKGNIYYTMSITVITSYNTKARLFIYLFFIFYSLGYIFNKNKSYSELESQK